MCHIRTGCFFPAILAGLSITCAPVARTEAAGIGQTLAGSLTAMPADGLGGHYAFTTRGRPVKVAGRN